MSEGACRPASLFRQAEAALRVFPGHEIVAQLAIGANRDRSTSPFCISAGAATANSRENFFTPRDIAARTWRARCVPIQAARNSRPDHPRRRKMSLLALGQAAS